MNPDIKITTPTQNYKMRVASIIKKDNKVLFTKMNNNDFYCLPGGYASLGETTKEALERELLEEIGQKIIVEDYQGFIENFFTNNKNQNIHELSFYYTASSQNLQEENFIHEEIDHGKKITQNFFWLDINKLENYNIKPKELIPYIKNNTPINHLIIKSKNHPFPL